ncbi:hypothetical protein D9M70_536500 [compost metagenome]
MPGVVQSVVLDALEGSALGTREDGQQGAQVAVVPELPGGLLSVRAEGLAQNDVVKAAAIAPDQSVPLARYQRGHEPLDLGKCIAD